ncbi:MAG: hypothetical protein AAGC45_11580 [Bacteroidota bacterium]
MKNKKAGFILVCAAVITLISIWALCYIDKSPEKITPDTRVEVKISSADLLASFIEDESKANSDFVERVIQVKGVVKEVTFLNNRYTVLLQGQGEYACLICDMDEDEVGQINEVTIGDTITLKGVCKGFLMDAILLNCVLVNP